MTLRGTANQANTDPISVPIHDPPLYVGTVLAETLKAGGIRITGKVSRDRTIRAEMLKPPAAPSTQPAVQVLAVFETPIENVISRANKDSINLYAECLCKRIGAAATGESGSTANGTAVMSDFVGNTVGIAGNEFKFDDGCGLSRDNGVSANAICRILEHDYLGPNRDAFVTSLAIGGVDGKTLKKRFNDDLKGRVFAKTGYIRGVSCLSGLAKSKDDQMFAFSILINDIYTDDARKLQDRIVKAIDQNSGAAVKSTTNTTH
jgi:D-alanyl-D-alanine carboxypeptidase/D-alanyl-D-alanine-endopeptidase (penicillin-binding protein 4)